MCLISNMRHGLVKPDAHNSKQGIPLRNPASECDEVQVKEVARDD